jgi:hypothetical protein
MTVSLLLSSLHFEHRTITRTLSLSLEPNHYHLLDWESLAQAQPLLQYAILSWRESIASNDDGTLLDVLEEMNELIPQKLGLSRIEAIIWSKQMAFRKASKIMRVSL